MPDHRPEVLFVCVHNAGRSQMAAALLAHHGGDRVVVRSAGTAPADAINPAVAEAMAEIGIDLRAAGAHPKKLTDDAVGESDVVITMGCGDTCPFFPGTRYLDWALDDPAGKGIEAVRPIRDEIDRRVRGLLDELLAGSLGTIEPYPGMELTAAMRDAVTVEERHVPGPAGAPDVRVLLYRPRSVSGTLPLVMSFHGGAFAMRAEHFPANDATLAMLGALVVSVDYRIVPEHPYPCGVEDCYAAFAWAVRELDIDPARVVVTGASAGGALAAAVALMARDRGGPAIALQALVIPVIDDRCDTPSMLQFPDGPLFNGNAARAMWTRYLGDGAGRPAPPYAAPGRAGDLRALPPAFIQVNGLDPLRDEGIDYARALLAAGVEVELYCAPGQHHGLSENPRTAAVATRLLHDAVRAAIA